MPVVPRKPSTSQDVGGFLHPSPNRRKTMDTTQIVRASADVVTIIKLRKGDVYKRLSKLSYQEKYDACYGIVQSIDYNGEQAMVTAIEIAPEGVKLAVFGTDSNLSLFAATLDEVKAAKVSTSRYINQKIDAAQRTLNGHQLEHDLFVSALAQLDGATTAQVEITAVEA